MTEPQDTEQRREQLIAEIRERAGELRDLQEEVEAHSQGTEVFQAKTDPSVVCIGYYSDN